LAAHGRAGEFFVLVLPHGMLELSAVFVAAGTGLRLGWRVVDPGRLPRAQALAEEGRGAVSVALGVVVVLAVSGALEAFVTPSPLPVWLRIGLGALAEAGFLALIGVRGRAAAAGAGAGGAAGGWAAGGWAAGGWAAGGAAGDLGEELAGATLPVA
ncbi:MAG: stage II sporulation protein M, partial [Mycobacteriales bacterium]